MSSPQFSDLDRLLRPNNQGDIRINTGANAIIEAFINRLLTKQGERVQRPEFGSRIHEMIFEFIDIQNETIIEQEVQRVADQESRITLNDFQIRAEPNKHRWFIKITIDSPFLTDPQRVQFKFDDQGNINVV